MESLLYRKKWLVVNLLPFEMGFHNLESDTFKHYQASYKLLQVNLLSWSVATGLKPIKCSDSKNAAVRY